MKNIIFILIFAVVSLYAKPCTTDIYFGNGVWNTQDDGKEGRDELKRFMQTRAITSLSIDDEKNNLYSFKHAYNPSYGTTEDLIETFYQLKESGQISFGYYVWIVSMLNIGGENDLNTKLKDIVRTYNDDAFYMFTKYDNESFSKKHNVLLVAHSQGNLFGNKMYTLMNDAQKEKFRMVSVATPADHVAGGGPYVTASGDYVIVPIQGSLPANVIGFGHTFLGTYLNIDGEGVPGDGSNTAPLVIAPYVKSAYDNLMQTTSCSKYDHIHIEFTGTRVISVMAKVQGENQKYDTLGMLPLHSSHRVVKNTCGPGFIPLDTSSEDDFYPMGDDLLRYRWITGTIGSIEELESKKNATVKFFNYGDDRCFVVSLSGELYTLAESAFTREDVKVTPIDEYVYMYSN